MASVQTPSITISPELMQSVEAYASDAGKSVDTVAEEALRFFIEDTTEANAIRMKHRERAAVLGIEIETYIAMLMKQWREEDREEERRREAARL